MKRIIVAPLGLSLLILPTTAIAQVKITVPSQHYRVHQQIQAKVENTSTRPVTFCVEFGQTSMKEGEVESTPSPFWVQRNSDGKWDILLIEPDVGSVRGAVVLEGGKSKDFPLRLNDSGKMRIRLNYWRGSIPNLDCHAAPKDMKLVTSAAFAIE